MSSIKKKFSSEKSKDLIELSYFERSHKSNLYIKCVDSVFDNIKLLLIVIDHLKKIDIKWVCLVFKSKDDITIPENTVWFEHKHTGGVCCHIEDFEQFYITNLSSLLTHKLVYVPTIESKNRRTNKVIDDDGWTTVVGSNVKAELFNLRKEKLEEIKKALTELVGGE